MPSAVCYHQDSLKHCFTSRGRGRNFPGTVFPVVAEGKQEALEKTEAGAEPPSEQIAGGKLNAREEARAQLPQVHQRPRRPGTSPDVPGSEVCEINCYKTNLTHVACRESVHSSVRAKWKQLLTEFPSEPDLFGQYRCQDSNEMVGYEEYQTIEPPLINVDAEALTCIKELQ